MRSPSSPKTRRAFFPFLALLVLGSCAVGAEQGGTGWATFNEGLPRALKQGKPLLVDVYTDWCGWCKVMDRDTFGEPNVKKLLADKFVAVKLNAESPSERVKFEGKEYSAAEFAAAMGVDGYPCMLFFDKGGKFVTKLPGFVKAPEFLNILEYVRTERYKTTSFDVFLKERKKK